jgi:hypothetical protein
MPNYHPRFHNVAETDIKTILVAIYDVLEEINAGQTDQMNLLEEIANNQKSYFRRLIERFY